MFSKRYSQRHHATGSRQVAWQRTPRCSPLFAKKSVRHLPLAQLEADDADGNFALNLRERPANSSTRLNAIQHISTSRLRVNRRLMVWLAARRQGCAFGLHLRLRSLCQRPVAIKDLRWKCHGCRKNFYQQTGVIIWHETRCAGGFQPAASDRAPDCRASGAPQSGLPPGAR
jgi:hypothetical protein